MVKLLDTIYKRYDRIKEPNRFLLFMAVVMIPIIFAANPKLFPTSLIVGSWLFMAFMLVTRIIYLKR